MGNTSHAHTTLHYIPNRLSHINWLEQIRSEMLHPSRQALQKVVAQDEGTSSPATDEDDGNEAEAEAFAVAVHGSTRCAFGIFACTQLQARLMRGKFNRVALT